MLVQHCFPPKVLLTLTILLFVPRRQSPTEPAFNLLISLPILLIHPLQHLIWHPSHEQLLPSRPLRSTRTRGTVRGVDLNDTEVAGDVVPVNGCRVDGNLPLAVQECLLFRPSR